MQYKYEKPDTHFFINVDEDLTPIRIDINKTIKQIYKFWNPNAKDCPILKPPPEKIANYGLDPKDQYFERREIPTKLKKLQKEKDGRADEIWRVLTAHKENWAEEIEFIKREWYHCMYGYWVYIKGKPTWISPWHYQYLNYSTGSYTVTDRKTGKKVQSMFGEYRDKDRRKDIAYTYLYTTTETFANIDKEGNAIPEEDGSYEMIDTGRLLFFGVINPKTRREGETGKSLSKLHFTSIVVAGPQAYSSMCANHESTVKGHWNSKFVPMWRRMAFFFKPINDVTTRPKTEITYKSPAAKQNSKNFNSNVSVESTELDSTVDFSPVVSRHYYDHNKITGIILLDEEAKTDLIDVYDEWNLVKPAMAQGAESERNRYAFSLHPSTVEDMEGGAGANFKRMCDASNFYQRGLKSGQTKSGLALIYMPSWDGLENFIGPYGESIIDDPTPEQQAFTKWDIGAKEYINSKIAEYEANPIIENLRKLAQFKRQNPPCYADIWRSIAGEIGFNIKKIDLRTDQLRRMLSLEQDPREQGDFVWIIDGYPPLTAEKFWNLRLQDYFLPKAHVEWKPSTSGRFFLSKKLAEGSHNRVQYNRDLETWEVIDDVYHASADPVTYQTKNQAKQREDKAAASFASGAVLYPAQNDDLEKPVSEWQSHKIVCTYKNKPQLDDIYMEEMLMMCRYFGCKMFPETNINSVVKHFENRGYGGLLRYAWLADKGKYRDTPGFHTGGQQSKDELISEVRDYIEYYALNENHIEVLDECRKMKSKEDMTKLDLFVSVAGALLSYKYRPMVLSEKRMSKEDEDEEFNPEDFWGKQR